MWLNFLTADPDYKRNLHAIIEMLMYIQEDIHKDI